MLLLFCSQPFCYFLFSVQFYSYSPLTIPLTSAKPQNNQIVAGKRSHLPHLGQVLEEYGRTCGKGNSSPVFLYKHRRERPESCSGDKDCTTEKSPLRLFRVCVIQGIREGGREGRRAEGRRGRGVMEGGRTNVSISIHGIWTTVPAFSFDHGVHLNWWSKTHLLLPMSIPPMFAVFLYILLCDFFLLFFIYECLWKSVMVLDSILTTLKWFHKDYLLCLLLEPFVFPLNLDLWCILTYFFMCDMKESSRFILLNVDIQLMQHHLLKSVLSPTELQSYLCHISVDCTC